MAKYIRTYSNNSEYEAAKASDDFLTPNVGYIEDTKEVKYLNSKKDLYNIYGTLTGDSATATIRINGRNYPVTPSGSDNGFGLNYAQPVTELSFYNQKNIKTLDKLDIDTSAVTSMNGMFKGCTALTSLDISGFDTSNVRDMSYMFEDCNSLTIIDVSNFNTSLVTNMGGMFKGCNIDGKLNLDGFVKSNVTNIDSIFNDCTANLIDVSNWDLSGITALTRTFLTCENITTLDLSSWRNTSSLRKLDYVFGNNTKLDTLNISNWDLSNVTTLNVVFYGGFRGSTVIMNNTNQATFDMMKSILDRNTKVTIIRDGVNWKYQNGEWVEV